VSHGLNGLHHVLQDLDNQSFLWSWHLPGLYCGLVSPAKKTDPDLVLRHDVEDGPKPSMKSH
jgi:hypothetical protein